jgi:rubrerythrin
MFEKLTNAYLLPVGGRFPAVFARCDPKKVENMEYQAGQFYRGAAEQTTDVDVGRLLGDLAEAEAQHEAHAQQLEKSILTPKARDEEDRTRRRFFVLQYVQPGLAGLMDGSVSTLAPLFAAAFATHQNWPTFLVGLAAALGAGISMAFAEALSDDGSLTGRGSPWLRAAITGIMTALGGLQGLILVSHGPRKLLKEGHRLCRQANHSLDGCEMLSEIPACLVPSSSPNGYGLFCRDNELPRRKIWLSHAPL